jgi:hypothetical protein
MITGDEAIVTDDESIVTDDESIVTPPFVLTDEQIKNILLIKEELEDNLNNGELSEELKVDTHELNKAFEEILKAYYSQSPQHFENFNTIFSELQDTDEYPEIESFITELVNILSLPQDKDLKEALTVTYNNYKEHEEPELTFDQIHQQSTNIPFVENDQRNSSVPTDESLFTTEEDTNEDTAEEDTNEDPVEEQPTVVGSIISVITALGPFFGNTEEDSEENSEDANEDPAEKQPTLLGSIWNTVTGAADNVATTQPRNMF